MSLQADLQAAVDRASAASQKLHAVVHGDAASTVETESGPVKTVAKAMADTEASLDAGRAELDAQVAAAASEDAAAASEAKSRQWAEEAEDMEVEAGAFSARHHAVKASAHQEKAELWAEAPVDQEVESDRYSARHWAEQARLFANGGAEFHGLTVEDDGSLVWTHGTAGSFVVADFDVWWLVPPGVSLSINDLGHLEARI
jgi:hypothetical protein